MVVGARLIRKRLIAAGGVVKILKPWGPPETYDETRKKRLVSWGKPPPSSQPSSSLVEIDGPLVLKIPYKTRAKHVFRYWPGRIGVIRGRITIWIPSDSSRRPICTSTTLDHPSKPIIFLDWRYRLSLSSSSPSISMPKPLHVYHSNCSRLGSSPSQAVGSSYSSVFCMEERGLRGAGSACGN